ncbi:hypothetical protein CEXT_209591 [Caerostris extrusa]|uniref:Uncharacterized protein n=1 Tax=Caerostris extrusa TaxID=172846 RepID=A0AAV4S5G3_CAEEX|nr:hypothetical protein CEXT_209591 [Caerostris extrusa]
MIPLREPLAGTILNELEDGVPLNKVDLKKALRQGLLLIRRVLIFIVRADKSEKRSHEIQLNIFYDMKSKTVSLFGLNGRLPQMLPNATVVLNANLSDVQSLLR